MIYTELTQKAMEICFKAHKDQVDKGGMPYVFHPFHLAEQMETEEEICTALLHDVMEDTDRDFASLAAEGFPPSVMKALLLLTHEKYTPYLDYVEQLSGNRIAARVKLADLRHNSMPGRLPAIGEKEIKRMRKYLRAQAILTGGKIDLEEMTLSLQTEIPVSGAACGNHTSGNSEGLSAQRADKKPALLTTVLEPDGSVRSYTLVLPSEESEEEKRSYQDGPSLLDDLEKLGYSAAYAAACLPS